MAKVMKAMACRKQLTNQLSVVPQKRSPRRPSTASASAGGVGFSWINAISPNLSAVSFAHPSPVRTDPPCGRRWPPSPSQLLLSDSVQQQAKVPVESGDGSTVTRHAASDISAAGLTITLKTHSLGRLEDAEAVSWKREALPPLIPQSRCLTG
jgi:hypothetical protein